MARKNEDTDSLTLHLDTLFDRGINFKSRSIVIASEITEELFQKIDGALTEMESHNKKAITIKICSEGGDVATALAVVGRLRNSKCKIITEGYGTVESAATLIFACGHERRISRLATFMHHESNYEIDRNRHSTIKASVNQAEKEEELWAVTMAQFSKKPASFFKSNGKHVDVFWTPEQLLEFGIADKII